MDLWILRMSLQFKEKIFLHQGFPTPGFPGDSVVKNPPANAGDTGDAGLIPGLERSPGVGNGNRLQYSCLEYSMDRGVWWATVRRVAKSQIRLKQLSMHTCVCIHTADSLCCTVETNTTL